MTLFPASTKREAWLLIDSLNYGGIESHVLELADGLQSFNQQVRVILLTKYKARSAITAKLQQRNIPHCYLEDLFYHATKRKKNQSCSSLAQLMAVIPLFQPSVIHAHGYKASIVSKISRLLSKNNSKQITTFHAGEKPVGRVKWYDRLDRYSAFISDKSIAVSQDIANKVPFQSTVINNFIAMPSCTKSLKAKKHIAFVGRLSPEKAPERFIKLASEFPWQQFHIYGTGAMLSELQETATSNIFFHGFQAEMEQHWKNIELLIIPSRYEGLPMTAIEAMARSIPVISLNVGAMSTVIESHHNGWIVQNMDEMSLCLKSWFSLSAVKRQQIACNAREKVKTTFSARSQIPKLLQFYN